VPPKPTPNRIQFFLVQAYSDNKPIPMMAVAASMVAAGSSHARQTMQTARQLLEA
jgi:hypothetical protein